MGQAVLIVLDLPEAPLDAAASFHRIHVPEARRILSDAADIESLIVRFSPVSREHLGWRLAAIQELAREAAPRRVNAIAVDADTDIEGVLDFVASAPGVTGQLLAVGPA